MTQPPKYTFLPWARVGLGNSISQSDNDPQVQLRASVPVDLELGLEGTDGSPSSAIVHKDIKLHGPGDVLGIDAHAIVKVEPENWITNFEPNLLPYVEFYDEDFPWRYTPAAAGPARLRPWIALVVLADDEFEEVRNVKGRPLPAFTLSDGADPGQVFPDPAQLWAWAHVHVSRALDLEAVESALDAVLEQDADLASARLLSPRRLAPNVTYHAFVIPTFESGRLAGIGADVPSTIVATKSAWAEGQAEFPYYHRWRFRTGRLGDFEYLVRLLEPKPVDPRVGVRDIDVLHPGPRLPPIDTPAEIDGVLKLGGALRVPEVPPPDPEAQKFEDWDEPSYPHPFQQATAQLIGLADDYGTKSPEDANPDADPDPIVTLPLYGRWHALTSRLLTKRDGSNMPHRRDWVHELNLDPRWRVAAGLGTKVVQRDQEQLMDAAWQQIGDVLNANRRLALAQLGRETAVTLYRRHLQGLDPDRRFALTAPVQRRVLLDGKTVAHLVRSSALPPTAATSAFRRVARPRGRLARRLGLGSPAAAAKVASRLDAGEVVAARPWGALPGALTFSRMQTVMAAETGQPLLGAHVVSGLSGARSVATMMGRLRARSGFAVTRTAEADASPADSSEVARFEEALEGALTQSAAAAAPRQLDALGLASAATQLTQVLDPDVTVMRRYQASVHIPSAIAMQQAELFVPAMKYPEFDIPMYEPLAGMDAELFLPNIQLIANNSITLLETNQRFIESYMVGLNHEMGRELLWREYPTDQRGSYFRQFWDVSSMYTGNPPPPNVREELRDIPPLHEWRRSSKLGFHNNREPDGDASQLVLVIRGELLKRYPNTVLFALKAEWDVDENNQPDRDKERLLTNLEAADLADPPRSKVRTPLFEARVRPDIFFIGFDLTPVEARGAGPDEAPTDDNAGWFFVLKERPGEPRFGLDEPPKPGTEGTRRVNWNSLTWAHVGTEVGATIKLDSTVELLEYDADLDQDNKPNPEDAAAGWSPETTAAELAYIMYQVPVMVAVHAWRMLQ